jgi:predicted NAD/FAD-binding protein
MHETPRRIAVVGSGIAGLSAAWLLHRQHEVILFERNDYLGGHTHTLTVEEEGRRLAVDTGFIVYNEPNYPHLSRLFHHLGVATQDTDMSFAVSIGRGELEYAGDNLHRLFAQRRNLWRGEFLLMLKDILRFNMQCKQLLAHDGFEAISLGDFLDRHAYGQSFRHHYLLPMAAAIWSCPTRSMLAFPAASLARFFNNHGLLNLVRRPQWKTVCGGSWHYVDKLAADLGSAVRVASPVVAVSRTPAGVEVRLAGGERREFDAVVMACHADEALGLLASPTATESALLSRFRYQPNQAWLHTDRRLMPRSRDVWSAWNYLAEPRSSGGADAVSVTYWMNRLQHLQARQDYLVSLNPLQPPRENRVIAQMTYRHPVFDAAAMQAQQSLHELQGRHRIWFCGSYFGYGFHEDALHASVQVARALGVAIPWLPETSSGQAPARIPDTPDLAGATG